MSVAGEASVSGRVHKGKRYMTRHQQAPSPSLQPQRRSDRAVTCLKQPLVLIGLAFILLTWGAAYVKINSERDQAEKKSIADAQNYALLFEQEVLRTASELDRMIMYLRATYERSAYDVDWATIVQEEYNANKRVVQIAIIDESGMMITSTAMLRPPKRVDLSDREHFKVHAKTDRDDLFISKPVLGRASGKWSVQFTRPFRKSNGAFGGVIVVSLDPMRLLSAYNSLKEFARGSFILVGSDGIIRASAGTAEQQQIGDVYRDTRREMTVLQTIDGMQAMRGSQAGESQIVASRKVGTLPLEVVVSAPEAYLAGVRQSALGYMALAAGLTIAAVLGIAQALNRQRHNLHRITALAHNDVLTGLYNRHSFQVAIADLYRLPIAERTYGLHLLDLDKFKAVNDTFGHKIGDLLLKCVAERLKSGVRDTDLVFRIGGDEFAVIQLDCNSQRQAAAVAARLCDLIGQPFVIEGHELAIGASIGIVAGSDSHQSADSMLQAADMALYQAKSEGRGTFRFYSREMEEALARRRKLEAELVGAAGRGELELHYQPKLAIQQGLSISGFEALVRWRHPEHGMLPPGEFIQIAEESGIICEIGEWVLQQACKDMASRPVAWTVAVNCSAVQLARGNVQNAVAGALEASGLSPERLEIEITETMLMNNDQRTLAQLLAIRRLGVKISLDDFGTGYSSLSYLHTYPVDCIKLDRSFVKTIGTTNDAGPIIRTIIAMAAELNLTTVAEGVETSTQLEALRKYGCTQAQGYLFSPPKPAKEVLDANWDLEPSGKASILRPVAA